jgi:hypothetical protein
MSDLWNIDYFNPPTPDIKAPSPKIKAPRLIPEQDDLFQVQRNSLKVLNDLRDLERELGPKMAPKMRAVLKDAENTYRVIRSYLEKYAT